VFSTINDTEKSLVVVQINGNAGNARMTEKLDMPVSRVDKYDMELAQEFAG
jgi:hypothetical protein